MMSRKANTILSLTSLLVLAASVRAAPITDQDAPWVAIFQKIYDTNQETASLTPADTLASLKQLQTTILADSELDANEMAFVLGRIQNLIDVSVLSESHCNKLHFESMSKIYDAHEHNYWNILVYLNHFNEAQIALCRERLNPILVRADDQFSEKELQDVATLVRQTKLHKSLNPASRIDGLLDLMEDKFGPIRGQQPYKEDKEKFVQLYKSEPEKLCSKVVEQLDTVDYIYSELGLGLDETEQPNKLTLTWIDNYQVCRNLLNDMNSLINSPSRALLSLISRPIRRA